MQLKLKQIYPTLIPYHPPTPNGYIWFLTNDNERFGIHEDDLTSKDIGILSTVLTRFVPSLPTPTPEAQRWYERIHHFDNEQAKEAFRFVFFSMPKDQIESEVFQEAVNTLFNTPVPILWMNEMEGILIELIPFLDSKVNYDQFIHVFIADLSVKIRFYIGEVKHTYQGLKNYYEDILQTAAIAFQSINKEVVHYAEATPHLLLHKMDTKEKEQLVTNILKNFQHDAEMIQTLNVFFDSNLNISETAKKLYMHRNSVQYRIDKYINETGINIQKFDEAIAVKLALLAKHQ